jgi:hypothetical protein
MLYLFEFLSQESFSFLVSKYGFHIVNTCTTSVCWNRGEYNVEIMFDQYRSHELQLRLFFKDREDTHSYYLDEILQLANIKDVSYVYQASTPERLSQGILKISSLFQEVCTKLDLFNQKTFDMLATVRKKNCDKYKNNLIHSDLCKIGDELWKEKNYEKIIHLYEQHIDILSEIEKKRYNYAKNKIVK